MPLQASEGIATAFHIDRRQTVTVSVYRAPSADGAIVVQIDTDFEPNGRDGGPGLRVLVNDADAAECPDEFVRYRG